MPDPSRLRAAYFSASRQWHPDRCGGKDEQFLRVRMAYDTLSDPASRLLSLASMLEESRAEAAAPPDSGDLFSKVASAAQAAREALAKPSAPSPLLAALQAARQRAARAQLEEARAALIDAEFSAQKALESLDARWPEVTRAELEALAMRLRFLARSRREIEEWGLKFRQLPAEAIPHV